MKRRGGFSLIELVVAIGIMSLLSTAFLTVVLLNTRTAAEERIRSALRQEGLSIVRAFLRDSYFAASAELRDGGDVVAFDFNNAAPGQKHRVVYRHDGAHVERLVWTDKEADPTTQTQSTHVRHWKVAREGELLRLGVELHIGRYTRDFEQKYEVATRVGRGEMKIEDEDMVPSKVP